MSVSIPTGIFMADDQKLVLAKLTKLIALERELQGKLAAIALEVDALLAGKPGIAGALKEVEAYFEQVWQQRYGAQPYVWTATRDKPLLKRLLKILTTEQVKDRMFNYLKNDEPFYVKAKHSIALFSASINTHADHGPDREYSVWTCPHDPHCPHRAACSIEQLLRPV